LFLKEIVVYKMTVNKLKQEKKIMDAVRQTFDVGCALKWRSVWCA